MTHSPAIRAFTPRLALKDAADTMDRKACALDLKAAPGEDGTFEGYASVFGVVDQGMDVVERGAFVKSLARRKPKCSGSTRWTSPSASGMRCARTSAGFT